MANVALACSTVLFVFKPSIALANPATQSTCSTSDADDKAERQVSSLIQTHRVRTREPSERFLKAKGLIRTLPEGEGPQLTEFDRRGSYERFLKAKGLIPQSESIEGSSGATNGETQPYWLQWRNLTNQPTLAAPRHWKMVFGVFTSPQRRFAKQLEAVLDTWGKDVAPHRLLVIGVNGSAPGVTYNSAPHCQDGHANNPGITCKEATLLSTGYNMGADWVLVFGSDNYVFAERFIDRLSREDANTPQIIGSFGCGGRSRTNKTGLFCDDRKLGLCGGGGYAISRSALDKMIGKAQNASASTAFVQEMMHVANTVSGNFSDQTTSCVARRRGIEQVNIKGLYGWNFCEPGVWPVWCPFDVRRYRAAMMNPAVRPMAFHYIGPDGMHKIHKMYKEMEEVRLADETLPTGWESGWSVDYMRLYYFNRDTHVSTWTRPPTEATLVNERNPSGQQVTNASQPFRPTSLLQISAADDGYDSQRATYIQMVDKERTAMEQDSFEHRKALYLQLERAETLLNASSDYGEEKGAAHDSQLTEIFDNDYESQKAAYIQMVDEQRAATFLSAGNTVN